MNTCSRITSNTPPPDITRCGAVAKYQDKNPENLVTPFLCEEHYNLLVNGEGWDPIEAKNYVPLGPKSFKYSQESQCFMAGL